MCPLQRVIDNAKRLANSLSSVEAYSEESKFVIRVDLKHSTEYAVFSNNGDFIRWCDCGI